MFVRNHGHGRISRSRVSHMAHMAKHGIASLCSIFSVYLWLLGTVAPQRSRTPEQAALRDGMAPNVATRTRRQGRA